MRFKVDKPRTFVSLSEETIIFDKGLKPFYFFRSKKVPHYFNLPAGVFVTGTPIQPAPFLLKYPVPALPVPEKKSYERIKAVTFQRTDTVNKAFILIPKKGRGTTARVFIDNAIYDEPSFVGTFVALHELGHLKYNRERLADRYAEREMLRNGFNPSQIYYASRLTLDRCKSHKRIKSTYRNMLDVSRLTFNLYK